jgi:hypothetical protein
VIVIRGANGLYSSAAISPGFLRLNATECMICTGTSPLRSVRKSR